MIGIMFVCHGNICRSPMAEFVFKTLAAKRGDEDVFTVASSAVSGEEIWGGVGNPVYPPARKTLAEHGIDCGGKRAVQLKRSDSDKYDFFLVMDESNLKGAKRILRSDACSKIHKLMDFTENGDNVADPWYSGNFETAYDDILRGCLGFYKYLSENGYVKAI